MDIAGDEPALPGDTQAQRDNPMRLPRCVAQIARFILEVHNVSL
jgi:hypothetical protein